MSAKTIRACGFRLLLTCCLALSGLACYDKSEYSPTAPETVNALTLSASASTLPADGFSRLELIARIDPNADASRRSVVFTTTAGSLVGSSAGDQRSLTVTADSNGEARAFLQSSTVVQTAIVQASVANVASVVKTLEIQFQTVPGSELLRIGTSATSAPADGATVVQVYADIAAGTPTSQRTISFTTSAGTFVATGNTTASAVADGSNRATVDLKSPADLAEARVTASGNGTSAQAGISYYRALPDNVLVAPDKIQLKATLDDSTNVAVTLLRSVGTVTRNTVVTYTVLDADTGATLNFIIRNVTPSDTTGRSQATIVAGNTTFRGNAIIRATTEGGKSGQATIVIVD